MVRGARRWYPCRALAISITSALSAAVLHSTRTPSNVCRGRNTDWVAGNSCVYHHNRRDPDRKVRDRTRKDRKAPERKHKVLDRRRSPARSHSRYWRRLPSGPTSSLAWATTSGADCACDVEVASCATVKAVVASSTMRRFVMMSLVPGKRLAATNSLSLAYWTTVNG